MTHFTQLGLSGSPDKKPETKQQRKPLPGSSPVKPTLPVEKKPASKHKTAVLVGSIFATALLGVFVFESGCSKESNQSATIATPTQTVASQPNLIAPISTSMPVASQSPAKKKSRQRKLSASTYTNPAYGVSFRYPKNGSLKEGDDANLELDGLGSLETNFVQLGGTTISAVELPRKLYAGTNFNAAFFDVSVNPKLTSEQCGQFAFPESTDPATDPVTTTKTKVGATEFRAVEGFAGEENNQADVKYYHVFQNGSCYEFALGLETANESMTDAKPSAKPPLKAVDRNEVFRRLNWILSTVKIQPITTPEKAPAEVATDQPADATNQAITQAH
jgi:hypothetical protein